MAYFVYGLSPDCTWMSIGADQASYVIAAKYNASAGLSGNPLYMLLGGLLLRLPGNEFWLLGLLSAIPAALTCVVIFYIVKRLTVNLFAPYIAALAYATSFVVWAEGTIAETYTLTALIGSIIIYFCVTRQYYKMGIAQAFGLGTHPLIIFTIIPCIAFIWFDKKDFKLMGKVIGLTAFGLLFQIRNLFITAVPTDNLFFLDSPYDTLFKGFGGYYGLAVDPFWATTLRVQETWIVFGSSLWTILFVLIAIFTKRKEALMLGASAILALSFHFCGIYPQWIKYMSVTMLPIAILAGYGIGFIKIKKMALVLLVPCLLFGGLNIAYYMPGKTIDPQPTTFRKFMDSLDNLPDNALVVAHTWGHPGLGLYYYAVKNKDRVDFINWTAIVDQAWNRSRYRDLQVARGINLPKLVVADPNTPGYRSFGRVFIQGGEEIGGYISVSEFAKQLQVLNPNRQVFVCYVKSWELPMDFGIVPADDYYPGLNNLPPGKTDFSGG